MKSKHRFLPACVAIALTVPAVADTIYSNLLNTEIPTDFTGVTVNINGGTINPFFGGVGVANSNLLQPVRTGTANLDTLANFSVGSTINVSNLFSTGYGGSQDHLGNTFTSGTEGYIGFQLNGTNYGWMRVVFTGNTSGAVIKDWAYDNSGQPIVVGRVNQSAPVSGAQTYTLSPGTGESFSLGSVISDTGGNVNSVNKIGAGTTILTQSNTYTGTTTISAGTLLVNGSLGNGAVSVNAGTLGGTGTIAGAVTVNNGGTLAAGASIESLGIGAVSFTSGSTFAYELDTASLNGDLLFSSGTLDITPTTTLTLTELASGVASLGSKLTLISYMGGWTGGETFTYLGNTLADGSTFTFGSNEWQFDYDDVSGGSNFTSDQTGATRFVTMTVVPEPNIAALLGALGTVALLRRRRA